MPRLDTFQRKLNELRKKREKEFKLSEEAALDQVCNFLDYYSIDISKFEKKENMELAGENTLESLTKYVRQGLLEFVKDDKGMKVIQHIRSGATIEYTEVKAKNKITMDRYDPGKEYYNRMYAFLGSLSGDGFDAITKLNTGGQNDLAVAETLGSFFLLV